MARKWRTVIGVWVGIVLYFGIGSFFPGDADFLLIALYGVLLLTATVYTLVIWVCDRARGEPEGNPRRATIYRHIREVFSGLHSTSGNQSVSGK